MPRVIAVKGVESKMVAVIEVAVLAEDVDRQSVVLAGLRHAYADADRFDPHSTLERVPAAHELAAAFRDADLALIARADTADLVGYGLVWSWVEDDGTSVHLLDPWAVPGPTQTAVEKSAPTADQSSRPAQPLLRTGRDRHRARCHLAHGEARRRTDGGGPDRTGVGRSAVLRPQC